MALYNNVMIDWLIVKNFITQSAKKQINRWPTVHATSWQQTDHQYCIQAARSGPNDQSRCWMYPRMVQMDCRPLHCSYHQIETDSTALLQCKTFTLTLRPDQVNLTVNYSIIKNDGTDEQISIFKNYRLVKPNVGPVINYVLFTSECMYVLTVQGRRRSSTSAQIKSPYITSYQILTVTEALSCLLYTSDAADE